ncbi:MAG: HAD family hydrolase [Hyphomicrobiales bacterium]
MPARAIIFDCDGVLVDSEVIYLEVERALLAQIGLRYDPVDYKERFIGLTMPDYFAALRSDFSKWGEGTFPEDFEHQVISQSMARIESELQTISGVEDVLHAFDGAKAVASSSQIDKLHKKLEITGLHHHFNPHIYSGDDVENGKPAPDLFLHAAAQIGHAPGNCIAIEDSANGVRSAVAAGMTVWGFTGGGHADDGLSQRLMAAGAHEVFGSFAEVGASL